MQRLVRYGWAIWLLAVAAFVLLPVLAAFCGEPRGYDPFGVREADGAPPDRSASPASPRVQPRPSAAAAPSRQVLFFSATWCGPCQRAKADTAWMAAKGWRVGSAANSHVRIVDADREPGMVARYGITSLPTFVLVERVSGREIARSGHKDKFSILRLWKAVTR